MGQKVEGFHRDSVYSKDILSGVHTWKKKVNPKGILGWDISIGGISLKEYGGHVVVGRKRILEVEERLTSIGYRNNGLGIYGDKFQGYKVYGEYIHIGLKAGKGEGEKLDKYVLYKKYKDLSIKLNLGFDRIILKYENRLDTKVDIDLLNRESLYKKPKPLLDKLVYMIKDGNYLKVLINKLVYDLESTSNHVSKLRWLEKVLNKMDSKGGLKVSQGTNSIRGGYLGYKIMLKGLVGGSKRKLIYVISKGKVSKGSKSGLRFKESAVVKTKLGTRGLSMVFMYGLDEK